MIESIETVKEMLRFSQELLIRRYGDCGARIEMAGNVGAPQANIIPLQDERVRMIKAHTAIARALEILHG